MPLSLMVICQVSSVSLMYSMFSGATALNGHLSRCDTRSLMDMAEMFHSASKFEGDLSNWDSSSVSDMTGMFAGAAAYNGNMTNWNVSSISLKYSMFLCLMATCLDGKSAKSLKWYTCSVMLHYLLVTYNCHWHGWDVTGATTFDGNLMSCDVSSITDMSYMFNGTSLFHSILSTDMHAMFSGASAFNSD